MPKRPLKNPIHRRTTLSRLLAPALRAGAPVTAALLLAAGCSPEESAPTPLSAEAEVLLDRMGVPHIYAASDSDGFFVSGFMTAKMRLFQIEMVRRQALGTQTEVLGERAIKGDLIARAFNFPRAAAETRAVMEREFPEEARLTAAFVRGVNHFIARVGQGLEPLPGEFTELGFAPTAWTDDDPYAVGKLLSLGMSSSLDYKLLGSALPVLAPQFPKDFPLCMPTRSAFTIPGRSVIMPSTLAAQKVGTPRPRSPERSPKLPPTPPSQRPAEPPIATLSDEVTQALARYERLIPELGSNNWAVAASKTDNGRPLIAGDPHQPLGSPIRFFLQHISTADRGGSLDVVGFGFAGTPGVQLGHNRAVAWTATTNFADVMDLWDVQRMGADAISLGGQARKTATRSERLRVRKAGGPAALKDGLGDDRDVTITDVPGFGVLLPDEVLPLPKALLAKGEILFNWTGLGPTREAAMYLGLDRARSIDEWEERTQRLEVGAVNLVAADSQHIRYRVHAKIPDRGDPSARPLPNRIMDGSDAKTLWTGAFLGEDKLPSARDPERGYLATANNEPWGFTSDGRVDNDPFYYGYYYDPGDRGYRIESELQRVIKRGGVSAADMVALQNDAYSALAEDLLPPLLEAVDAIETDPALAEWKTRPELVTLGRRLRSWDRQMRRESPEAVVFFAMAHFATKRAVGDELGPMLPTLFQAEPAFALKPLRLAVRDVPGARELLQEGKRAILVGGLADAADWLKKRFGTVLPDGDKRYAWKDVHGASFDHILGGKWSAGVSAIDGSVGTVRVSASSMLDGKGMPLDKFSAHAGSLYRMVVGFDEHGPRAQLNFPRGNDENPQSEFYANQHAAWIEGTTQPLAFRRTDVEATTAKRIVLHKDGTIAP